MTKKLYVVAPLMMMLTLPFAAQAADKAGDVVYLKGSAVVERQEKKIKAALKAPLEETDNVQTRESSRLKILFRNDSILTLGSNTKLAIKQYLHNPQSKRAESIYELADGKLKSVVGGGPFKVTTPTAFAAARGTVFIIWYDKASNTTWLAVTEGGAEFGNSNPDVPGKLIITAGHMSSISGNEPPKLPKPFTQAGGTDPALAAIVAELGDLGLPGPLMPQVPVLPLVFNLREQAPPVSIAPPINQLPAVTAIVIKLVFP
jgi:hypothetical protein